MKSALIGLAIVGSLCAAAAALIISNAMSTCQLNEYPSCTDAREDELFGRGWVPDVLPTECGPIIAAHDLDTNDRYAAVSKRGVLYVLSAHR